jgi:Zn-finger nucleic acid-binding protein
MNCPVDQTPLTQSERSTLKLATCTQCHGLWIPRETLKQAFTSRQKTEFVETAVIPPKPTQATSVRRCPCCHSPLAARWLHGIEIDVCEPCHGLWLDAGELKQIIAQYRERHGGMGVAKSRSSSWLDTLDVPTLDFLPPLIEGLGDLAGDASEALPAIGEFLVDALSLLDW